MNWTLHKLLIKKVVVFSYINSHCISLTYRSSLSNKLQINISDNITQQQSELTTAADEDPKKNQDEEPKLVKGMAQSEDNDKSVVYSNQHDKYYWFDEESTIMMTDDTDLGESTSPLYQNQEDDPKVRDMMFQEEMKLFDN